MVTLCFGGAWEPTPESREMADDLRSVIGEFNLTDQQAADLLGIPKSQLSEQLANRAQLSLYRVARLPWPMKASFYRRQLRRFGWTVIEDARLATVYTAAEALLHPKRMARVGVPAPPKERAS